MTPLAGQSEALVNPAVAESLRMSRSKRRNNNDTRCIPDHKARMTGFGRVLNSELILRCYSLVLPSLTHLLF